MKKYLKKMISHPFYQDESGGTFALVCGSLAAVVACTALGMETANYYKSVSEIQSLSDSATSYAASNANSCVAPNCNLDSLVDDFVNKRVNKSSNITITTSTTNGFWRDDGKGNGSFTADCSSLSSGSTCKAAVRTNVNAQFRTLTNLIGKNWVFNRDSSDVVLRDNVRGVQSVTTGSVTTFGDLCPLAVDYRMFTSDNGKTYDRYWDKDKSKPKDDGYFPGGDLPDNRGRGVFVNDKNGSNGYKFEDDNKKSVDWVAYLYVPKNSETKASWPTDPSKSDYDDQTKIPSNRTTSGSKLGVGDTVWMHGRFPVRGGYSKSYSNNKPKSYKVDNVTYLDSPTNPNWWKWATVGKTCLVPVVKDIKSGDKGPYGNSGYLGKIVSFTSVTIKGVCPGTAMWNTNTKRWDAYTNELYTTKDSKCEYGKDGSYVHPYAVIQFGKRDSSGDYSDFDGPNTKYDDDDERESAEHLGAVGFKKRVYSR